MEDWVEAWWNTREGSRVPLGRWCGLATPGPLQSPRGTLGLRIALHTDSDHVASGFKARYVFEVSINPSHLTPGQVPFILGVPYIDVKLDLSDGSGPMR